MGYIGDLINVLGSSFSITLYEFYTELNCLIYSISFFAIDKLLPANTKCLVISDDPIVLPYVCPWHHPVLQN